jgi:hypothetical protein
MADIKVGSFEIGKTQTEPYLQYGGAPSSVTTTPILDAASSAKYNDVVNGNLNLMDELKNMASFSINPTRDYQKVTEDTRNDASNSEKKRIKEQKSSFASVREDAFAIGTVFLTIPPTSISVSEEKHNFRYKTLRGGADIVTTSGRSTTRIDLDVVFTGLEEINNKLRPLIAQFKCTPFLPIDNVYLRSVVDPESMGLDEKINEAEATVEKLKKDKQTVDSMNAIESNSTQNANEMISEIKSLQANGVLNPTESARAMTMVNEWFVKGNSAAVYSDTVAVSSLVPSSVDGAATLDMRKYIYGLMTVKPKEGHEVTTLAYSVDNLDKLSKNIDKYREQYALLVAQDVKERATNKILIGVLSQLSVSTTPGFPDTLSCRISMHVFNYDPYTFDFGFVNGYNPQSYTPDITDCDVFIDWYSNRFLASDGRTGSLGTYQGDNVMSFTYATHIGYDDLITGGNAEILVDRIHIDGDTVVVGASVTMRNIVQFLPILSGGTPTCQYMGAYNSSIQININSTNLEKVKSLRKMMAVMARMSRKNNKLGRYNMLKISNELASLCGIGYFAIDTFSVDTVPGSPGLYSISVDASEVKIGQERAEQLDRLDLTSNLATYYASKFILEKAKDYLTNKTPSSRAYYNMLFGNQDESAFSGSNLATVIRRNTKRADRGYFQAYYESPARHAIIKRLQEGDVFPGSFISNIPHASATYYTTEHYIDSVQSLMNGGSATWSNGDPIDWSSTEEFLAHAYAEENSTQLKRLLNEGGDNGVRGMVDMTSYVESQMMKTKGAQRSAIERTCYPDLGLPTYADLGAEGEKFKLTYRDLGLLTPNPMMADKAAQTNYIAIEPDAFYSKVSIHKIIDNVGNPGIDAGIRSFKDIAENNKTTMNSPQDPSKFVQQLVDATAGNDSSKGVEPEVAENEYTRAIDNIQGGNVRVVKAIDGNTFVVSGSGGEYTLRLTDYNPKKYEGGTPQDQPAVFKKTSDENTKIANKELVGKTIVPVILPNVAWFENDRTILGAQAYILGEHDEAISIPEVMEAGGMKMADRGWILDHNKAISQENSLTMKQQDAHDRKDTLSEIAIYAQKSTKIPVFNMLNAAKKAFASMGIIKGEDSEVTRVGIKTMVDKDPANSINNRFITQETSKALKNSNINKNKTFDRFDRYSSDHINGIAERIKSQSKDDTLRMVKAFPTFKFYFVLENRMEFNPGFTAEFQSLDDMYSYNAIMSIDINKSRKEAADVAIVRILNTKGILDRDRFGLFDPASNNLDRAPRNDVDFKNDGTIAGSETLEEFVLQVGTRIKIKMGYSSDPQFLENVFTGQVTEVSMGDVVTVVAQGYGTELLKPITGWANKTKYQDYSAYKVLDRIILRSEITHFGFSEWNSIEDINSKNLYRRYKPYTGPYSKDAYKLSHPAFWREFAGASWLLRQLHQPQNDNIFTPEVSKWAEETKGDGWEFNLENRTVWDIFQEFTVRMPGYIAQVLPFDNRATMYFGPSDGYYNYSNFVKGIVGETRASLRDDSAIFDYAVKTQELSKLNTDETLKTLDKVSSIVNDVATSDNWTGWLTGAGSSQGVGPNMETILQTAEVYLAKNDRDNDRAIVEDFRKIAAAQGSVYKTIMKEGDIVFSPKININVFTPQTAETAINNPLYKTRDGHVVDKETYLLQKITAATKIPAHFKMARAYHYVDSLRNIISNNIYASDENMWNKVEIVSNVASKTYGDVNTTSNPNPLITVRAQVDDSLWKEQIKTRVYHEQNARTIPVAWNYAIGHLKLGVNEMYGGHLTVLGDATIKPNDVIFMNDYYTDMNGAFEVREVNHHFSHDTGFVTTVVPDCICYANNSMAMASEATAGGWYDDVSSSMLWVYNIKVPFIQRITPGTIAGLVVAGVSGKGVASAGKALQGIAGANKAATMARAAGTMISRPLFIRSASALYGLGRVAVGSLVGLVGVPAAVAIGGAAIAEKTVGREVRNSIAAMQYAVGGWSQSRREPINFLPLIYGTRPFIAGVKGMRRSDWWEPGYEAFQRLVFYRFNQAPRYISQIIDQAMAQSLDSGVGGDIIK